VFGLNIEFKKGNSIWIDLVSRSEIVLKSTIDSKKETFTLFFIPYKNKTGILEIIGARTVNLISKIGLSSKVAKQLVSLHKAVPRSLNAQASLIKNDVKKNSHIYCRDAKIYRTNRFRGNFLQCSKMQVNSSII